MPIDPLLKQYLAENLGLDVESIGPARVHETVERVCGVSECSVPALLERLQHSEEDRHRFYEELTVPETWFLRGRPALHYLAEHARLEWLPNHEGQTLRILSIPCSTGEEPYSVLMMLEMDGFPMDRVELHAADISGKALAQARAAAYGDYSFRGVEPEIVTRYFVKQTGSLHLHERLRTSVRFFQDNAVLPAFFRGQKAYDVILCRNLLIYLVPAAREAVLKHLKRLLHRDGILLAGHSEVAFFSRQGWIRLDAPHAFAFHHPDSFVPPIAPRYSGTTRPKKAGKSAHARSKPLRKTTTTAAASTGPHQGLDAETAPPESDTEDIRRLADAGRLDEASDACEAYLKTHPLDAEACCLAGILENARNHDRDAIRHFEKALYLDPEHHEALYHLTLLYLSVGNGRMAEQCRQRLARKQHPAE